MRKFLLLLAVSSISLGLGAQSPAKFNSAEIYLQLKKLNVLGSVLYIAAHPDDENTRLLAWLSKERLYRTGYLSLTRGDGGQNLIGDEQGIDLGLLRTQELLAARRIDGAEQFFSTAYDFGFSKTTEEAFAIWNKEKILGDAVWIIRKFRPDVIVTRFPEDSRAGHGHHSGSAVIAHEAFIAAADPRQFPEQLKQGVEPWQAKRILWNTFNFGGNNTTSEQQLKIDVGAFNPLLGKSYGEVAAESRSQHKSQGFGVPGSRGSQLEYFTWVAGSDARNDLMDEVNTDWSRVPGADSIALLINQLVAAYDLVHPEKSVKGLVQLYKALLKLPNGNWPSRKLEETKALILACGGIFLEAASNNEYAVQGDSIKVAISMNNRLGIPIRAGKLSIESYDTLINQSLEPNRNYNFTRTIFVSEARAITQPYWMEQKKNEGSFNVENQQLIGLPQNQPAFTAAFDLVIEGQPLRYQVPVQYKSTDPVRGELFQPLVIVPPLAVSTEPSLVIFHKGQEEKADISIRVAAHRDLNDYSLKVTNRTRTENQVITDTALQLARGISKNYVFTIGNKIMGNESQDLSRGFTLLKKGKEETAAYWSLTSIKYDHVPHIHYFYQDAIKVLNMDLKTVGKKIGYIEGAGDRVTIALQQMGYEVTILKPQDINPANLKQFDAIITGVRAYNVNEYMAEKYEVLMNYVKEGGNLIVQYNTINFVSTVKAKIGPYPFTISRGRITDETAAVKFELPNHPALNYPNKLNSADFDGWIQERSIYNAEQLDPAYATPLSMADPGEQPQRGSLIIANYGRGNFVYTGLVFFRELPAGVPGAYRLLANLIALNKKKGF